jgi:hypothetical protein
LFFALTGFSGYQWHRNLYRYAWTAEERKVYLETISKETVFQEKNFSEALERIMQDRKAHEESVDSGRDLFAGARKKE